MVDVYEIVGRMIAERRSARRVPTAVGFYDIYKCIGGDMIPLRTLQSELDALVKAGRLEQRRGMNGPIYYLTEN